MFISYRQGCIVNRYKESDNFADFVARLESSKSALTFKINLYQLIKKYAKLTKQQCWCSISKTFLSI